MAAPTASKNFSSLTSLGTAPAAGDEFYIQDASEGTATNKPKRIAWSVVEAYLDTLYAAALGADDNYVTDAEKIVVGNTSGTNTGDMSNADVKTAYEANADTNAVTDAEKTVLGNTSGANSGDVTLAGTPNYITIVGQVITRNLVDLTADVTGVLPVANYATGTPDGTKFVRDDGTLQAIPGGGDALTSNPLSQFAATTSAQLAGVLSDETGSGSAVFGTSPTLVTPALGTPASGVLTNCTGTAAGLTAGNVTTNANLTGHITSTGNAAVLGSFTVSQLSTAISDATLSGNNSGDEVAADLTTAGVIEIATVAETNTGTDATRAVSPDGLDGWTGSAQVVTVGTLSSGNADAAVSAASDTVPGKIEIATIAETDTGTDATRAVSPDGLEGSKFNALGKKTIFIPAVAMTPTASNGCAALATVETTSGRPDMNVLDFDATSDEHAQFQIAFPKSWNLGTVTFQAFWTTTATDTDGVAWGLQGVAAADNDTIDVAYGTAIVVTDDNQSAAEDMLVTAESAAITIAGTPADDDMCFFRLFRDVSDANDDMTEDARLIGIKLFFTTDIASDD